MKGWAALLTGIVSVLAGGLLAPSAQAQSCVVHPSGGAGRVSSVPKMRFHPTLKYYRWHKGIDLALPTGRPVYAATDGVARIAWSNCGGNLAEVWTGGVRTRYFHLSRGVISNGQTVKAGDLIGYSGNTGSCTTGPHLHFELWQGNDFVRDLPGRFCSGGQAPIAGDDHHDMGVDVPDDQVAALGPVPTGPDMSSWDDLSPREIIANEANRRYLNPQWLEQLATQHNRALLVELEHSYALQAYLRERTRRQRERIELLAAARSARNNRIEMEERLARQRDAAAKAN